MPSDHFIMTRPPHVPTPKVSEHTFYDRGEFLLEYEDEIDSLHRSIKEFCCANGYPFFQKLDIYKLQRFVAATSEIRKPLHALRA